MHAWYRQQLIDILGQATADEVIALRGQITPEAPITQHGTAQPATAAATASATSQAEQAAAADLHDQAAASIPQHSQLAQSLASADPIQASAAAADANTGIDEAREQPGAAIDELASQEEAGAVNARPGSDNKLADDQQDTDASTANRPAAAGKPPQAAVASKLASSGVTVVRSNPRFASKLVKEDAEVTQSGAQAEESAAAATNGKGDMLLLRVTAHRAFMPTAGT